MGMRTVLLLCGLLALAARADEVRLGDVVSLSIDDRDGVAHEIGPAQLATFDPRPYKRERAVAYSGRALLSAAQARGNAPSEHWHVDAQFTARARTYRYELSGRSDQRSAPSAETESAWLAGANYDRFLGERQFVYARGSLERDRAKDIDARGTMGAGYGVQLLETEASNLSLRGGLDYVAVDRIVGPREGERRPAPGRASTDSSLLVGVDYTF